MTGEVLLTGASGYAGGAIAAALGASGMTVLTAGRRPGDRLFLDLLDPRRIAGSSFPEGVEVLVHAAAAHEVICRQDPVAAFTANVTATRALVDVALAAGVKRLVYISTFHVFGAPAGRLDEAAVPDPGNDYGLTHLFAEQVVRMAAQRHGLPCHILRPANLFGVPANWTTFSRWTLAPFDFVCQAVDTGKIVLRTDGSPVRNYVSLSRLGEAVLAAARGELPEVTHLAGRPWSMRELAGQVAEVVETRMHRPVAVALGSPAVPEAPYDFLSGHWATETDGSGEEMRNFLGAFAGRLQETQP